MKTVYSDDHNLHAGLLDPRGENWRESSRALLAHLLFLFMCRVTDRNKKTGNCQTKQKGNQNVLL